MAILCMLYKIRCNPVDPLNSAVPGPYVPAWALVEHRYTYVPHRFKTKTFIPLSVSLWNVLDNPVFNGVLLTGFKSRATVFFIGLSCSISSIVFYYFPLSLLSVYRLVLWGWTDRVNTTLSQPGTDYIF